MTLGSEALGAGGEGKVNTWPCWKPTCQQPAKPNTSGWQAGSKVSDRSWGEARPTGREFTSDHSWRGDGGTSQSEELPGGWREVLGSGEGFTILKGGCWLAEGLSTDTQLSGREGRMAGAGPRRPSSLAGTL